MPELLMTYDDPMFRIIQIRRHAANGSERVRGAWDFAFRQPSWIARFALTVFLLIVLLPIMALMVVALLAGILVFLVLTSVNAVLRTARNFFYRESDGRENVRVIRRET